jgi:tetratricopeptide (TPR) repeat protein
MRRLQSVAALVCVVGAGALAGSACATAPRTDRLKSHLIRRAPESAEKPPELAPELAPQDSFEAVISKIRHLAANARPAGMRRSGTTVEHTDPRLAEAVALLEAFPTAAAWRLVAAEYVRLGILDAAYDHYRRAVQLDPRDAAAYDGLARVWRDSGFPHLGLGDARRAAYFAPYSAEAHNTLGTLHHALGQRRSARDAYEFALMLEPGAAYALNNLCYLSLLEGDSSRAIALCQRAIVLDPSLLPARRNLALSYASADRLDLAEQELLVADARPVAFYNLGIIGLARRDYASALAAFETACDARPAPPGACDRVERLRAQASPSTERVQ